MGNPLAVKGLLNNVKNINNGMHVMHSVEQGSCRNSVEYPNVRSVSKQPAFIMAIEFNILLLKC